MKSKTIIWVLLFASALPAGNWLEPAYGLWSIGVVSRDRNYTGVDTDISFSPLIFGGYGPVFIEANRIGYSFYRNGTWFASVAAMIRSHQYRRNDDGLSDRKNAIEMGLHLGRRLPFGFVSRVAFMHDIIGSHQSYELDVQLFRHDRLGPLRSLLAVGLQFQGRKLVDYYYGTSSYEPDNAFGAELEVIATYPVGKWGVFAGTRIYLYDSQISNSPLANSNRIVQFFSGIGYYL